jgi:asparagine synthase (glutamine-hydrolysing)
MCGIAGIISGALSEFEQRSVSEKLIAKLARRGPDGSGIWQSEGALLVHTRLAILDLSADADQPMIDPNTGVVLVFNGEIYNFVELRSELEGRGCIFRTRSDSEVLLKAFLEWGPSAFERMVGMWACAIFDPRTRQLVLSRDRFGIKPLYVSQHGNALVFGSTVSAVVAASSGQPRINGTAVHRYITARRVDDQPDTFFHGIFQFPAASHATINIEHPTVPLRPIKFWSIADHLSETALPMRFDGASRHFRALLNNAIQLHTRSDVEVGSCLSGGLDSSTIVGILASLPEGRSIRKVFSATLPGHSLDEYGYSKCVAQQHGLEHRLTSPSDEDFLAEIDQVIEAQEEPFGSTGVYLQWKVMQLVHAANVKVVLDGQGADEYLGGYLSFHVPRALEGLSKGDILEAAHSAFAILRSNLLGMQLASNFRGLTTQLFGNGGGRFLEASTNQLLRLPVDSTSAIPPFAMEESESSPKLSRLKIALSRYLTRFSLPALLRYEDRNSMWFSIESRVPFLDHRLVEFALSQPDSYLINRGVTKSVLRAGVGDVVPHVVVSRRDKIGFGHPESNWVFALRNSGRLDDLLSSSRSANIVDQEQCRALVSKMRGASCVNLVWRLYCLMRWNEYLAK